jgi:hypothetical protein
LLRVCSLPFLLLQRFLSYLYSFSIYLLYTFFLLFRGLKYNRTHQRIEPQHYSTESLLFGTAFFAIVLLLFPTILVFYLFFSCINMLLIAFASTLWWALLFVHFFPFYLLFVYFFFYSSLPAPIRGYIRLDESQEPMNISTIEQLESQAMNGKKIKNFMNLNIIRDGPTDEIDYSNNSNRVGPLETEELGLIGRKKTQRTKVHIVLNHPTIPVPSGCSVPSHVLRYSLSASRPPFSSLFFPYRHALDHLQSYCSPRHYIRALLKGENLPNKFIDLSVLTPYEWHPPNTQTDR